MTFLNSYDVPTLLESSSCFTSHPVDPVCLPGKPSFLHAALNYILVPCLQLVKSLWIVKHYGFICLVFSENGSAIGFYLTYMYVIHKAEVKDSPFDGYLGCFPFETIVAKTT